MNDQKDQILLARLNALEKSLTRVIDRINDIRNTRNLSEENRIFGILEENTWNTLWYAFGITPDKCKKELQEIQKKLKSDNADPKDVWEIYQKMIQKNEHIFSECVEFLGGLALRDKSLDYELCELVDDLIGKCDTDARTNWRSLTLPAPDETFPISQSHIIRLQVLEHTIWTLPLVAYRFAYMTLDSKPERMKWFENYDKKSKQQMKDLMSVSLATCIMGPAYVCSAITMNFNPQRAYIDDDFHVSDSKRAYVMFSILKRMDNDYENITRELDKQWKAALSSVGMKEELEEDEKKQVDNCMDNIWFEINEILQLPSAIYPSSEMEEGWLLAKQWCHVYRTSGWAKIKVNECHSLRDVLNAAWLCRIDTPDVEIDKLEAKAKELCKIIIDKRREARLLSVNSIPKYIPAKSNSQKLDEE